MVSVVVVASCLVSPALACTADRDASSPFANVERSDSEIGLAIKRADQPDDRLHPYQTVAIILQGVFGPCYVVTTEEGQITAWKTYSRDIDADQNRDTIEAVEKFVRAVGLMKRHGISDNMRPANIEFDLLLPQGPGK